MAIMEYSRGFAVAASRPEAAKLTEKMDRREIT